MFSFAFSCQQAARLTYRLEVRAQTYYDTGSSYYSASVFVFLAFPQPTHSRGVSRGAGQPPIALSSLLKPI